MAIEQKGHAGWRGLQVEPKLRNFRRLRRRTCAAESTHGRRPAPWGDGTERCPLQLPSSGRRLDELTGDVAPAAGRDARLPAALASFRFVLEMLVATNTVPRRPEELGPAVHAVEGCAWNSIGPTFTNSSPARAGRPCEKGGRFSFGVGQMEKRNPPFILNFAAVRFAALLLARTLACQRMFARRRLTVQIVRMLLDILMISFGCTCVGSAERALIDSPPEP